MIVQAKYLIFEVNSMLSVKLICVGSIKEKYYIAAAGEYMKRLSAFCRLNVYEVNECLLQKGNEGDIAAVLEKEGKEIIKRLGGGYTIALCIEGKSMNSEQFSKHMENVALQGISNINFIIGGSHGISDEVKKKANLKLSFSSMTFPHQLMRVILLEQIYRGFSISNNSKYHK